MPPGVASPLPPDLRSGGVLQAAAVAGDAAAGLAPLGGAVDRLGAGPHRNLRGPGRRLIHKVARSAGVDQDDDLSGDLVMESPRSGASFWSLGDVSAQVEESRALAARALRAGLRG